MTPFTPLKIIHLNCNSALNKLPEIALLAQEYDPDIILLQESLCKRPLFILAGLTSRVHRPFVYKQKRGIEILLKPELVGEEAEIKVSNQWAEIAAVDIFCKNKSSVRIVSYYATPTHNRLPISDDIITNILNSHPQTIIIGDLNGKLPRSHDNPNRIGKMLEKGHDSYTYYVSEPPSFTRYGREDQERSIIDLVITKCTNIQTIHSINVAQDVGSDHRPIIIELAVDKLTSPQHHNPKPNFDKADWMKYREIINTHLDTISPPTNTPDSIDVSINQLTSLINQASLESIPHITPKNKRPTFPPYIISLIKRKRMIRGRRFKTIEDRKEITRLKNRIRYEIKQVKILRNQRLWTNDYPKDKYHFYKTANSFFKCQPKTHNSPIKYDGKIYYSDSEKAECFKELYESIFALPPHPINSSHSALETQANNHTRNISRKVGSLNEEFNITDISTNVTQADIDTALRLSRKTSPGHDNIHYIQIKQLPDIAKSLLSQIYQQCLELAYFPSTWKTAITILLPKPNKNLADPNNFRPISLLPTLGKTLERIINNRLVTTINDKNLIPGTQAGFRKGRSTQDQLFALLQDATNQIRKKHITLSCFFDLHKAYDKLWVEGLVYKLKSLGLTTHTQTLLLSFLTHRQVKFRIKNALSSTLFPTASTPQGAILSPLIFNLFVSDIPQPNPPVYLSQFADDIATWCNTKTPTQAVTTLQPYTNKLARWCTKWKLKLATEKTQLIAFRRKGSKIPRNCMAQIINGETISCKTEAKFLGILLDEFLSMNKHFEEIKTNLQRRVSLFFKITGPHHNPHCPSDLNLKILKSMIIPVITYAPVATALFTRKQFSNLDKIIRKGIRTALYLKQSISNKYLYDTSRISDNYGFLLFKQARKYLQHDNRSPEIKALLEKLTNTRHERNYHANQYPTLFDKLFPLYTD